jgi:chorismate mutase
MTPDESTPALDALRRQLAEVDARLVHLLAERLDLARRIGEAKRAAGLPLVHPDREAAVLDRASALARVHSLDETAMRELFARVIAMSRSVQASSE